MKSLTVVLLGNNEELLELIHGFTNIPDKNEWDKYFSPSMFQHALFTRDDFMELFSNGLLLDYEHSVEFVSDVTDVHLETIQLFLDWVKKDLDLEQPLVFKGGTGLTLLPYLKKGTSVCLDPTVVVIRRVTGQLVQEVEYQGNLLNHKEGQIELPEPFVEGLIYNEVVLVEDLSNKHNSIKYYRVPSEALMRVEDYVDVYGQLNAILVT